MNANVLKPSEHEDTPDYGRIILPPDTLVFPCSFWAWSDFKGWEDDEEIADATTWPHEPRTGRLLNCDVALPGEVDGAEAEIGFAIEERVLLQAVYSSEKDGPFTGSFRLMQQPAEIRAFGAALPPDENGIRIFNPEPAEWDNWTHWAAITGDLAVWILDKEMKDCEIKSYPYPIATKADLTEWIRSGVAYGTMPAGEKVALRNTGETGTVVTAYRDDYAMGVVVALETRGYNVHVLPADITIDAAAQVTLQCQLAALR